MAIHVRPIYFTSVIVLWLLAYHVAYWSVAIARDSSLVCWSIGPFGISTVSLREPRASRLLAQLCFAAVVVACLTYASLFVIDPAPIDGLQHTLIVQGLAIAIPVVALTAAHLLGIIREQCFPLWGEARVLAGVQRSVATRARVYFTPSGRAFLHERFGATPHEFLRMVR